MRTLVWFCVVGLTANLMAQESRFEIHDPELNQDVVETVKRIESEVARSNVDWAGQYTGEYGVDDCTKLWIAPASGLVVSPLGSDGRHVRAHIGDIAVRDDIISVSWRHSNAESFKTINEALLNELAIVRSEADVCLIPLSRLHGFCLSFQNEKERRYRTRDWFRKSDTELTAQQLVLPLKYRYLQTLPRIEAQVLVATPPLSEKLMNRQKKRGGNVVYQQLLINRGSKDGVFVGMDFQLQVGKYFTITEVEESTSRINCPWPKQGKPVPIKPGFILTTAEY